MARPRLWASAPLPRSFVPDDVRIVCNQVLPVGETLTGSAVADLFRPWARAVLLFAEIAEQDGVNEAQRIFTEVIKRARGAIKQSRRPRPPPKKHKGPHDPVRDSQLLVIWELWTRQNNSKNKTEFAKFFMKWNGKSEVAQSIVKRLNRKLAEVHG